MRDICNFLFGPLFGFQELRGTRFLVLPGSQGQLVTGALGVGVWVLARSRDVHNRRLHSLQISRTADPVGVGGWVF